MNLAGSMRRRCPASETRRGSRHIIELPGITNKGGDVSDWIELDPNNKDRLLDVGARQTEQQDCDSAAPHDSFISRPPVANPTTLHVARPRIAAYQWTPGIHRIAFLTLEPASGKTRSMGYRNSLFRIQSLL
jgi:hypothetical protein